jgi:hypothetical protein
LIRLGLKQYNSLLRVSLLLIIIFWFFPICLAVLNNIYLANPMTIFLVNIDVKLSLIVIILIVSCSIYLLRKCIAKPVLVGFFTILVNFDIALRIVTIAGWENDMDFIRNEFDVLHFF